MKQVSVRTQPHFAYYAEEQAPAPQRHKLSSICLEIFSLWVVFFNFTISVQKKKKNTSPP